MIFVHKCGREAKLNISGSVLILASISFAGNKFVVSKLDINKKENKVSSYNFFCIYCGKIVLKEEVKVQCMNCGDPVKLDDRSIPIESNGIYCNKCITKRFSDEKAVSTEEYLNAIYIK